MVLTWKVGICGTEHAREVCGETLETNGAGGRQPSAAGPEGRHLARLGWQSRRRTVLGWPLSKTPEATGDARMTRPVVQCSACRGQPEIFTSGGCIDSVSLQVQIGGSVAGLRRIPARRAGRGNNLAKASEIAIQTGTLARERHIMNTACAT